METLQIWLSKTSAFIWGLPLILLLGGTGIYLTFRLRCLQITNLTRGLRLAFGRRDSSSDSSTPGDISRFQALMTTSAATIGTGNIVGVSTALAVGGPGALFWMWLIAVLGMATKYAEAVLAVKFRTFDKDGNALGGPMLYLERGLGMKWLAIAFALFGSAAAFGIGNTVQANAVAENVRELTGIAPWITGTVLAAFTALVLLGGIKGIGRTASVVVPFMALFYIAGCLWILFRFAGEIPSAFAEIFRGAFAGSAATGGFSGATIILAVRMGVARGIFSNESGLGSAPIAAAAAKTKEPCEQGLVSMIDTFFDTLVICTLTGLVLIVTGEWAGGADAAGGMAQRAFSKGIPGGFGGTVVGIGIIFFAYSTILGWSYYGEQCCRYLFGTRVILPYRLLWIAAILAGATVQLELVWNFADILNGLMAAPNLVGLLGLSGVVAAETRRYLSGRSRTGREP